MKTIEARVPSRRESAGVILAVACILHAGCDLSVTNPGPVADDFLDDPGAHESVVEGANFMLSASLWAVSYIQVEMTGEQTRAGRNFAGGVGPFSTKSPTLVGMLTRDHIQHRAFWDTPQAARWQAEDASRRFVDVLGEEEAGSYALNARAKLIAGHANRLAGENLCVAVIDGGEIQSAQVYFQLAEAAFEDAIEIANRAGAPEIATAARAGLAQVLGPAFGRWGETATLAEQIPEAFAFQAVHSAASDNQYNQVVYISEGDQWRDLTTWDTFFEAHYAETGDPRIRSEDTGRVDTPEGLPLVRQRKWTSLGDDINLSSGREMVLLRAEALLRDGEWEDALGLINELRAEVLSDETGEPIPEAEASNLEEAWSALKLERYIELWMEGRRMFDLRRWIAEGIPGEMEDMSAYPRLCIPILRHAILNNPNIPDDYDDDPVNPLNAGG